MIFVKWTKHESFIESSHHKICVTHDRAQGIKIYTLWQRKSKQGLNGQNWSMVRDGALSDLKKYVQNYHENAKRKQNKKDG